MSSFRSVVDIANRACQHVGARKIASFTDGSKTSGTIASCYDDLREAEMRRNVWRFTVRKAALRPVDADTRGISPAAWAIGTTYALGAVALYSGQIWESTVGSNLGNTPGSDVVQWELYCGPLSVRLFTLSAAATASDVSYYSGELVRGNGSSNTTTVYRSLVSNNSDIPPSANWLSLGTISATLNLLYPVGAGPSNNSDTRNIFMLPGAFLREAPQDPKDGNISFLGAPHGNQSDDWEYGDGYIVSATTNLIIFRFAASVTTVSKFDPMFCEGLGARLGLEICETLTQSTEKLQMIGASYKTFMSEARQVNGIEQGPVQAPLDDYIVCRF
jgi:hypothetical protein